MKILNLAHNLKTEKNPLIQKSIINEFGVKKVALAKALADLLPDDFGSTLVFPTSKVLMLFKIYLHELDPKHLMLPVQDITEMFKLISELSQTNEIFLDSCSKNIIIKND
jgi:hypothetical protein